MLKKHRILYMLVCVGIFLDGAIGTGFVDPSKEITVSAAISLKNAFEEIGKVFDSQNNTKTIFNFGASGDLALQIGGGAPVDVFASADQKDMNALEKKELILEGTRDDFAKNSVVLIKPTASTIAIGSVHDLSKGEIHKIVLGNPATVPAGRYAKEVLTYFKLWDGIQDKLIFAENVRQVLDYVARGEVDAGVVYATDAATRLNETKIIDTAPEASHTPAVYPIAVIKGTQNKANAKGFISLILSPEGQQILQKYGFTSIK